MDNRSNKASPVSIHGCLIVDSQTQTLSLDMNIYNYVIIITSISPASYESGPYAGTSHHNRLAIFNGNSIIVNNSWAP